MSRRRLLYLVVAACLTLAVTPAFAGNGGSGSGQIAPRTAMIGVNAPFRDGTVLVGFSTGTTTAEQTAIEHGAGASEDRVIGAETHVLRVPAGKVSEKIALLKAHPRVRYAEPDYVVRADMTTNDPSYSQLWGMAKIRANSAWDTTMGSRSVVVGVVDTGIDYTHPDLAANVWSNNGTVGKCAAGTHGYNALANNCDPMDDNNHGTHVSGTIGAVGNNGIGVIGVNASVSIMGLKFLNSSGYGFDSGAVAAIDWAIRAKQAGVNVRVLSNSWGGGSFSQSVKDVIAKAAANDILVVAAAGNSGRDVDATPFYPCSYGGANEICVASSEKNDNLSGFSNYGLNSVDLSAPGSGILSTIRGGTYGTLSGTSMATPHVSGAAALALSTGYLSATALKARLLAAVDPISTQAGKTGTGGRLDVCKAIPACSGVAPPPPPPSPGDFSLSASPSRQTVAPGGTARYVVDVTPTGGFVGSIALSLSGAPDGTLPSFSPSPLNVATSLSTSSDLVMTAAPATASGTYTLTITGANGVLTRSTSVVLQVKKK